jgi:hypothetical protein
MGEALSQLCIFQDLIIPRFEDSSSHPLTGDEVAKVGVICVHVDG